MKEKEYNKISLKDLSNPKYPVTILFTHPELKGTIETYDAIQDEIRHTDENAKSHCEEIKDHFGGNINNILNNNFKTSHDIPFSTFTIRITENGILYVDAASRRVKIEGLILGLKVVLDERNMNSSNINKYLLTEDGLKFKHMKTDTFYTNSSYLTADDIVHKVLGGNYNWEDDIMPNFIYRSNGRNIPILKNQDVNFKKQIDVYINLWRDIKWFESSEQAEKGLLRILDLHKFNFNSEEDNRGFQPLNKQVDITTQAKIYNEVKSTIENKLESNKIEDIKFQKKFKEHRLDMDMVENAVAHSTKEILSNMDIHERGREGMIINYVKFSLPIIKDESYFKVDKDGKTEVKFRNYYKHLVNDFTDITINTIMNSKVITPEIITKNITTNICSSDWKKSFESLRESYVNYPNLRSFLRPMIAYFYYHDIPITIKITELLGYLDMADSVTVRGEGFPNHHKNVLDCFNEKDFQSNIGGYIIKHFIHEKLSSQIARGKVESITKSTNKSIAGMDFVLGCEGVSDRNQREWRKRQQRFIDEFVNCSDKTGLTTEYSSEHHFNQKGPDKNLDVVNLGVNQFSLTTKKNKELNQRGCDTPLLKKSEYKKMDFYDGPTLHQMANNVGHFKNISFKKNKLYDTMKLGKLFLDYYEDMANKYHDSLSDDWGKVD